MPASAEDSEQSLEKNVVPGALQGHFILCMKAQHPDTEQIPDSILRHIHCHGLSPGDLYPEGQDACCKKGTPTCTLIV